MLRALLGIDWLARKLGYVESGLRTLQRSHTELWGEVVALQGIVVASNLRDGAEAVRRIEALERELAELRHLSGLGAPARCDGTHARHVVHCADCGPVNQGPQQLTAEQAEALQRGLGEFADYVETARANTPLRLSVEHMRVMFEAYLEDAGCFSLRRPNAPLAEAARCSLTHRDVKPDNVQLKPCPTCLGGTSP